MTQGILKWTLIFLWIDLAIKQQHTHTAGGWRGRGPDEIRVKGDKRKLSVVSIRGVDPPPPPVPC